MGVIENVNEGVISPLQQKKMAIEEARRKAEAPFEAIKAKQAQTKAMVDISKQKAESAKKLLEAKELLQNRDRSSVNNAMSNARSRADKAKNSVEERQRDFRNNGDIVKSLIEKIEKGAGLK